MAGIKGDERVQQLDSFFDLQTCKRRRNSQHEEWQDACFLL